jgi:hypothetical protein
MADFRNWEIPEFCAVLIATLEGEDWLNPLTHCRSLLTSVRTTARHELPAPHQANTRAFINDLFPEITRKLLSVSGTSGPNCTEAEAFLIEAISTICTLTFSSVSYKPLLPLLADIFDPGSTFFVHNGRGTSPFSDHLLAIGKAFCESGQATQLLAAFTDPKFPIDDIVAISMVYNRITHFLGHSKVFPNLNAASDSFAKLLQRYQTLEQRQIPVSGIEKLVTNLAAFCHEQPFIDSLVAFIPVLIESEIAELKMTGVTLCSILFTQVLTPAQLRSDDDTTVVYLTMWLTEIVNREGLNLIKPVLLKVAQVRGLAEEMVDNLWVAVNRAPDRSPVRALRFLRRCSDLRRPRFARPDSGAGAPRGLRKAARESRIRRGRR